MNIKGFVLSFALAVGLAFGQNNATDNVNQPRFRVNHVTAEMCATAFGSGVFGSFCKPVVYVQVLYKTPIEGNAYVGYLVTIQFIDKGGNLQTVCQYVKDTRNVAQPSIGPTTAVFTVGDVTLVYVSVQGVLAPANGFYFETVNDDGSPKQP